MKQTNRKLVGLFILLALLFIYPAIASAIYTNHLVNVAIFIQLAYFALAGLLWAIPAGIVIKWMAKPNKD